MDPSGTSAYEKVNQVGNRIEGMRKEGHELVQWCLQPIELHIIRVYQSPVEDSDEESNSRDHVLKTPGELIEERECAAIRL